MYWKDLLKARKPRIYFQSFAFIGLALTGCGFILNLIPSGERFSDFRLNHFQES
jgi:hypothetical protein